jgi:hypothetical protein
MDDNNEQIIERLLKLWYDLIGGDHHKDRDCWFFIERDYCTYQQPSWSVRHAGYILGDHNESFTSFLKAQEGLIEFLIENCAKEIHSIRNNFDIYSPEKNSNYCDTKLKQLEKIVTDQHYISEKA